MKLKYSVQQIFNSQNEQSHKVTQEHILHKQYLTVLKKGHIVTIQLSK